MSFNLVFISALKFSNAEKSDLILTIDVKIDCAAGDNLYKPNINEEKIRNMHKFLPKKTIGVFLDISILGFYVIENENYSITGKMTLLK